jgi:N-acetylglucosamine-6-phosphate deacetylase
VNLVAASAVIAGKLERNVLIEYNAGVITSIQPNSSLAPTIAGTLLPGFVDIHCHGGGGYYFSALNPDQISTVIQTHRAHGTTAMLASLVTEPIESLLTQIQTLRPFINQGAIKGIHLEGPYLAHSHCGAHDPALLKVPTIPELEKLIEASDANIRMVTIAPELNGAIAAIEFLVKQGVTVALGHTGADAITTRAAIAAGATVITHFNNGMPKLDTGENISSASLNDFGVALELILDGVHINESSTRRILGSAPGRFMAITDAMSAAGAGDGNYTIGSLEVLVLNGVARLTSKDAFAGSTLTMDRAFLNLVNNFGVSITGASFAASTLPAERIGLRDVGSLEVGKLADFVEFTNSGLIKPLLS